MIGKMLITAFLLNTYERLLVVLLLLKWTMDYISGLQIQGLLVQANRSYFVLQENIMF